MVKVHLHGILDVVGKPIELTANSAREASEAVMAHLRRTNPELFKTTLFFQVLGYDEQGSLDKPLTEDTLHFMPAFTAGKKAGIFQIIVGAVLVVGGAFLGLPPTISLALLGAGIGMVLGGALQLLTPVPRLDTTPEDTNPEASKYLSGAGNTTKMGTRIPLVWGTFPVYGHFLSINIQSRDIAESAYSGGTYVSPYEDNYNYGYSTGNSINVF